MTHRDVARRRRRAGTDAKAPSGRAGRFALAALVGALRALVEPSGVLAQPQGTPFGETVEVRVINLEVVVTDRQGLPVTGLGPQQFILKVDGETVPIEFFTEVRGGGAVDGPSEGPEIPGVPQLAPGTAVGTSYLVFVDDFFALERDRNHVLERLKADLAHLRPEDRMAIVAYDGRKIDMLTTWSQSAVELEKALKKATSRPAFGLQRIAEDRRFNDERRFGRLPSGPRGFIDSSQMRLDVEERDYAETLEENVENMVSAASAALRGFAKPPGRKVLLLLSGGWPFDVVDFVVNDFNRTVIESRIDRGDVVFEPLIATANQLGYTIYGVDVPGLVGDTAVNAEYGARESFADRRHHFQRESNVQYSLEAVSRATGGEALLNGQRDRVLSAPAADTRSYYWLGFTPPWQGSDAQHDVKVETTVDGLRVRNRSGYVDFSTRRETSMAVESALLFGDRPDMMPMSVEIGEVDKSSGGRMKVPITLRFPLDRLTLLPQGDKLVADVELRIAALDDHGGRSEVPVIPVSLTLSGQPPAGAQATYSTILQLRRTRNQLVLAISDPASGSIYTARAEVAYK